MAEAMLNLSLEKGSLHTALHSLFERLRERPVT
jgi:hypothetical protein